MSALSDLGVSVGVVAWLAGSVAAPAEDMPPAWLAFVSAGGPALIGVAVMAFIVHRLASPAVTQWSAALQQMARANEDLAKSIRDDGERKAKALQELAVQVAELNVRLEREP